ncbi:hypothetical protein AMECASPLE_024607 [Ameca splendens]|uniref:Uncharacterized protein n=1 Tax=Ameca splendens TaxID=208324 RepID=A0ABV0ZDN6_9TELE
MSGERKSCTVNSVLATTESIGGNQGVDQCVLTDSVNERTEVTALRTVVLQNRMVLNLLMALVVGAYALLNETCCTYIPDETNSEDGHRSNDIKDGWRNCWYNVVPGLPTSGQGRGL